MNKNRFIYFTDSILILAFAVSLTTGIELHVAEHGAEHGVWHMWAVFHTIASLLFLAFAVLHIKSHWGWYKSLKKGGLRGRRRGVLLLSVVFLLVVVSGLLLLFFIDGAGSPTGRFHYKIGLIYGLLGIWHIVQRGKILCNGFRMHVLEKKGHCRKTF